MPRIGAPERGLARIIATAVGSNIQGAHIALRLGLMRGFDFTMSFLYDVAQLGEPLTALLQNGRKNASDY